MGISYFTPLMSAWEWFPDKKGTISGVVLGVLGSSYFFFGFISLAIVNPDNDKQDPIGEGVHVYPRHVADRVNLLLILLLIGSSNVKDFMCMFCIF